MNNNYFENKDAHDARIVQEEPEEQEVPEQNKVISKAKQKKESLSLKDKNNLSSDEKDKRLKWYEKNYGPYIGKRGLGNWKNLFRKPTMRDLLILVILACVFFSAWAYKNDIQTCQDTLENLPKEVCEACSEFRSMAANESLNEAYFNLSNLKFTNIS